MKLLNSAQFADLVVDGRNNAYKNFMVNAGKAWDDAYFSDTNDVRAQRLGSSNSAAMIPEFLYDFENQRVITPEYDTDWQDELYRNAPSQRHHISVNGVQIKFVMKLVQLIRIRKVLFFLRDNVA